MPLSAAEGLVRLSVRLTPGAKKDQIDGVEAGADGKPWLRVRVSAPPVDGKANQALVKYLAKRWRVPKTAIKIVSGITTRNKILIISGDAESITASIKADL